MARKIIIDLEKVKSVSEVLAEVLSCGLFVGEENMPTEVLIAAKVPVDSISDINQYIRQYGEVVSVQARMSVVQDMTNDY